MKNSRCTAFLLLTLTATLVLGGCSLASIAKNKESGIEKINCVDSVDETTNLYVTNLGWHTGIVLPREVMAAVFGDLLPETAMYPWTEIGWGDRDFYMSSGYSYVAGAQALFFSSGSALHVAGLDRPPEEFFLDAQLFIITIKRVGLRQLLDYIRSALTVDKNGSSNRLGASLYGKGSFYEANGSFSLFHTCNSWTAAGLVEAGCKINPNLTRASTLTRELRKVNDKTQQGHRDLGSPPFARQLGD
jgi:uncharacterized protein (TIGR02117 family)